jgi:hypothetical protein
LFNHFALNKCCFPHEFGERDGRKKKRAQIARSSRYLDTPQTVVAGAALVHTTPKRRIPESTLSRSWIVLAPSWVRSGFVLPSF